MLSEFSCAVKVFDNKSFMHFYNIDIFFLFNSKQIKNIIKNILNMVLQ